MPLKITLPLLIPLLLLAMPPAIAASPITETGMATVPFSGKTPTPSDYRAVEQAAEINAIERYVAATTNAESRNFAQIRDSVASSLSQYVLGATPISKQVDTDADTLTMVVRVDLDTAALANAFRGNSAVTQAQTGSRSYIAFIFVARQQAAITRYSADNSRLNASQVNENGTSNAAKTSTGGLFADQKTTMSRHKTEVSQTQRAATVKYGVTSSGTVNTAMTGVFADAGYRVVPSEFLESATNDLIDPKAFEQEFAQGDDISAQTLMNAVEGAQKVHLRYLAVGTMDRGMSNTDPETGLQRVYVTVTGRLYDLGGLFPQTLVSVGPEQYAGLGPTESVAETNALTLAAKSTAQKMAQAMAADQVH